MFSKYHRACARRLESGCCSLSHLIWLDATSDAQAVELPAAASSSIQLQDTELQPGLGSLAALAAHDALCQTEPGLAEVPDRSSAASVSALLL